MTPRRVPLVLPLALLLAIGVAWGAAPSLARFAVTRGVPPMGYVFWMGALAATICLVLAFLRGAPPKFSRKHVVYYLCTGCTRLLFAGFVMYTVLGHVPASVVAIVLATAPLMTYIIRVAIRDERFDILRGAGIFLGFVGIALLFVPKGALPDPSTIGWLALGFVTPMLYTLSNLTMESLRPTGDPSISLTAGMFITVTVVGLPLAVALGQFHPLWETGLALREVVMFTHATIIALCFFGLYELFRLTDPTFGSQVSYLTTLFGVVFGIVLLGERPSLWIWGAVVCILGGLLLVNSTPSRR